MDHRSGTFNEVEESECNQDGYKQRQADVGKLKCSASYFTSTPETRQLQLSTRRRADGAPARGNMSAGGISEIVDSRPSTQQNSGYLYPPLSATFMRDTFYDGYPLSCLTEGMRTTCLTTHAVSEIVPSQRGFTLTCHRLSLKRKIEVGLWERFRNCTTENVENRSRNNTILRDISAYFAPGMNAVMGPTGSGKTSLLSALSLRNTDFQGTIRLNGNPAPRTFAQLCGFSIQDDVLNPRLTARQHLWFSLCLRRGGIINRREKRALVEDILKTLRLDHCGDEKVGTLSNSSISSGERKRINIGMELVVSPKIIFLDEPTSNLDSTTSKCIIRILKCLADNGRTIILSVHQASSNLNRMFDNLTLIAKGRLIYHGPTSHALDYFASLGFPREPHYSPPDYYLDIIFGKVSSNRQPKSVRSVSRMRLNTVRQTYFSPTYWTAASGGALGGGAGVSHQNAVFEEDQRNPRLPIITVTRDSSGSATDNNNIDLASPKEEIVFYPPYLPSCLFSQNVECEAYAAKLKATIQAGAKEHLEIARWLAEQYARSQIGRETAFRLHEIQDQSVISDELQFEISSRDAVGQTTFSREFIIMSQRGLKSAIRLCGVLVVMNMVIGLIFGMMYYHTQGQPPSVQSRLGMFFYLSVHGIIVPSIITAKSFALEERSLFEHERRGRYYRAVSYCASRCAILIVLRIVSAFILSTIIYWMTGLKSDGGKFLMFTLTMFTAGLACDSMCLACILGCKSFAVGKSVAILYKTLTAVFAGYLVNLDTIFPWLSWIKYFSITRYCFVAWAVGEFSTICFDNGRQAPASGHEALSSSEVVKQCGTEGERMALIEFVGRNDFFVENVWSNHVILLMMSLICLFLCYLQMRKIT